MENLRSHSPSWGLQILVCLNVPFDILCYVYIYICILTKYMLTSELYVKGQRIESESREVQQKTVPDL